MSEDEIRKTALQLSKAIDAMEAGLQGSVESLQAKLADLLVLEIVGKIKFEASTKIQQTGNQSVVSLIDRVWNDSFGKLIVPVLKAMYEGYQKLVGMAQGYFERLGLVDAGETRIEALEGLLKARIGIDRNGNLTKDGYLFRLGKSDGVREELKVYVQGAINRGATLVEFQTGFKNLVNGNANIEGALVRYYRQYAFDTFNQISEWSNLKYAQSVGLEFFIYEGSIIATSRAFCIKRARKVFHVSETKDWVNDPDLIDKKTKGSYDPIIDRGRYNCRHIIRWITYELAAKLRPDVVRFKKAA